MKARQPRRVVVYLMQNLIIFARIVHYNIVAEFSQKETL